MGGGELYQNRQTISARTMPRTTPSRESDRLTLRLSALSCAAREALERVPNRSDFIREAIEAYAAMNQTLRRIYERLEKLEAPGCKEGSGLAEDVGAIRAAMGQIQTQTAAIQVQLAELKTALSSVWRGDGACPPGAQTPTSQEEAVLRDLMAGVEGLINFGEK